MSHAGRLAQGVSALPFSVSQKLAIALALFLVPLGYVTARLTNEQQKAIDFAAKERAGVRYLMLLSEAEADIGRYLRSNSLLTVNSSFLRDAIETIERAQHMFGGDLSVEAEAREALTLLRLIYDHGAATAGTVEATVDSVSALRRAVGDRSNLILDPDLDSYYAMDVVLMKAPALHGYWRDLSAVTRRAAADGRISGAERSQISTAARFADDGIVQVRQSIIASFENNRSQAARPFVERAEQAVETLNLALIEEVNRARGGDSTRISVAEAEASGGLSELTRVMSAELDRLLDKRITRFEIERTSTLFIAAALFALALAATLAILRRGVVQPLSKLTESIRSLAVGSYDEAVPLQTRADEIGEISRAVEVLRELARAKIGSDAARAAAESASLAKSQFLANMSHELRTPLNAIIGYAELLHEDAVDGGEPQTVTDLERILSAARHLLGLINDVLDLSKIEAGRMDVAIAPADIREILDDVHEALRPLAAKNENRIVLEIGALSGPFATDAMRFRQCLFNLASNACKFTHAGIITIRADERKDGNRRVLTVSVRDTGIGMTGEQMSRLFQPFSQADATITREFGGTGLGLMLTRHMANLLGGDVTVESEPQVGSIFTLTIQEQAAGASAAPAVISAPAPEGSPCVLVVDDEDSARDLVLRALAPLGFSVVSAATAAEGAARAVECAPALIILDVHMPDRSGWELLAAWRRSGLTASSPVIVLSIDEDRQTSLALGAAEHLIKPIRREVLVAAALRLARSRGHADDASATAIRPPQPDRAANA